MAASSAGESHCLIRCRACRRPHIRRAAALCVKRGPWLRRRRVRAVKAGDRRGSEHGVVAQEDHAPVEELRVPALGGHLRRPMVNAGQHRAAVPEHSLQRGSARSVTFGDARHAPIIWASTGATEDSPRAAEGRSQSGRGNAEGVAFGGSATRRGRFPEPPRGRREPPRENRPRPQSRSATRPRRIGHRPRADRPPPSDNRPRAQDRSATM